MMATARRRTQNRQDDDDRSSKNKMQSTLAVDKDVADRIRDLANNTGITTVDMTNQLLEFALAQSKVEIEVKRVSINPAATVGRGK